MAQLEPRARPLSPERERERALHSPTPACLRDRVASIEKRMIAHKRGNACVCSPFFRGKVGGGGNLAEGGGDRPLIWSPPTNSDGAHRSPSRPQNAKLTNIWRSQIL